MDEPLTAVRALGHTVAHGPRAEGLKIRRGEEGVMVIYHQLPTPVSVDTQDPQLPVVTGNVGTARAIIRGGAVLLAAVSNVIAVFCREENKEFRMGTAVNMPTRSLKNLQLSFTRGAWVGKLQRGRF